MTTAHAPPKQNGIKSGGPINTSSRLKEGRALAQDVWSIYESVLVQSAMAHPSLIVSHLCFSAQNLPSDCINLGQGYMNFAPPSWARQAAEDGLKSVAANHYSHPKGRLRLRQAVKKHYEPDFNRSLNAETEILITSGANEGQFRSFMPLFN